METFEANEGALMETASPALPLAGLLASMQAAISCGAHKYARTTIEASEGTPDFPANSSNPCINTALPTSMTFVKKTTLSVCRNECRPEKSSRRLRKFCKRRNGLFKKAHELSNLYNAEVAVIVASPYGKVSEFASSSMSHILKRYQSFQPQMLSNNVLLHGVKTWKREAILLSSRLKALQELERFSKNMPSSINVAQSFESMLAQTMDEIHKRKMELLEVEIQKIVQEGEILCKENTMVKEKLMQIMLIKECISSAVSGSEEFYYQPGLDMLLQCVEEESSTSSKS